MKMTRPMALLCAALVVSGAGIAQAGDAAKGEAIFKKCKACHTVEPGKKKIGPSLHGIIGMTAGIVEGFKYSKAMIGYGAAGTVWTEETLSAYLEAPRKVVKGTKMAFPGLKKPEDRADVIAYLAQFSE